MSLKKIRQVFVGLFLLVALLFGCKDNSTVKNPVVAELGAEAPKITCDTFEILTDLKGALLNVSVKTDLPPETQIIIAIERIYHEKDNDKSQGVEYFNEKSTVGTYELPQSIPVDNEVWFDKLKAHIQHMTLMNKGGYYDSIDNQILVRITVPTSQESPQFGKKNENLVGLEVIEDKYNDKYIQKEITLVYPLDEKKLGIRKTGSK